MMLVSFLALNIILIFFRGKVGEGILKKMFHHDETFLFPSCDVLVDLKKKRSDLKVDTYFEFFKLASNTSEGEGDKGS